MKRLFLILLLACFWLAGAASATPYLGNYSSNLIFLDHFNEWPDLGRAATGQTLTNTSTTIISPGQFGNMSYYSGSARLQGGGYSPMGLGTGDFTFMCWLNRTTSTSGIMLFTSQNNDGNRLQIWVYDSRVSTCLSNVACIGGSTSEIPANSLHQIVVKRTSGNFTAYIDGVYNGSTVTTYNFTEAGFAIGAKGGGSNALVGKIDEMALWNTSIPISELWPQNYEVGHDTPSAPVSSFTTNQTAGASPLPVHLTDTSTGTPTAWGYNATCLENSTTIQIGTTQNLDQVFDVGHWLISLIASNAYGQNVSAQTTWINVSSEITPLAMFSSNKTVVLFPGYVGFTDLSANAPTTWEWSFGDGTYSTTRNATHQFVKRGRWTVLLNASNSAGYSLNVSYITVLGG